MSQRTIHVLLVEDSLDDELLIVRELRRNGYQVVLRRIQTSDEMRDALEHESWDIIISDFSLPLFSGPAALGVLKEANVDIPFIIVSGSITEEFAVASLKAGAQDFITKGKLSRLGPAIERELADAKVRRALRQAESDLRQAQKLEAIGRLAGGVAHDFNNVLTVITGHAQILLEENGNASHLVEDLEAIREAAERATALTSQLLAFSRKQVLMPSVLQLNDVVQRIQKMLARLVGENIAIVMQLEERLPHIVADETQIEQILMNLTVNARDAMPNGGTLTITTTVATGHGQNQNVAPVLLEVTDTGEGMDPETLSHIFEPFYTTKATGKGTGLGLATVYGIIEQSGGQIVVESERGRGTTFRISFMHTSEFSD